MRLIIAAILLSCAVAKSATITAASCNDSDVATAFGLAAAGDTVEIPAGSCAWDQNVTWSAPSNITVRGAGTSVTGGGDVTVISDNFNVDDQLLDISIPTNGVFRLTGITFQTGTATTAKDSGTIAFSGSGMSATLRIDHCRFSATHGANYKMLRLGTGVHGVMDNCIVNLTSLNGIYAYNGRQSTGDDVGNWEWTQPTDFGGPTYFYIEDCIATGTQSRLWDGFSGAKIVVRFCMATNLGLAESHATGHALNDRGTRSMEIYCNAVYKNGLFDPPFVAVDMSSGTALAWGNSWNEVHKHLYLFNVTRKNNTTYGQSAPPDGWGYAGTEFLGSSFDSDWDGGTYEGTDTVTGYPCLDQPGRGAGDLLTGDNPGSKVNAAFGTLRWPRQAHEPIYLWNNTGVFIPGWGGSTVNDSSSGRVVSDRDRYQPASGIQTSPTSPFNGTTGCGWGTLANRPTTCTTGVGYFATDQGSWNTSTTNYYGVQQNGADGVLYKATATDTWTLYYTPYTYPHPLRNEAGGGGSSSIQGRVGTGRAAVPKR